MVERSNYVGQRVGNYRLVQLLGKGGFAEVYLGTHIHLNTQVAVKLLHTRLANEDVEDFRREAQIIARLMHPNIVRVLDFGVEGEIPYLAMDYAPNGTLRQRHAKGSRVPVATIVTYVKQVAEALQHAHDQRLVHRDVKPENMLLGRGNDVLLSDFGIALAAQSSQYQNTQNVAGTIGYMAPEQIQAHPRPASDQYSLGVVVYEWLSGARPFQGSLTEIAIKHSVTQPPSLRYQIPHLPLAIEEVVMIALAKDPYKRFASMRAFANALERADVEGVSPQTIIFGAPASTLLDPHILNANNTIPNVTTRMQADNSQATQRDEQSRITSKPYPTLPVYPAGLQGNSSASGQLPAQSQWVPSGNNVMQPAPSQFYPPYAQDPRAGMYQNGGQQFYPYAPQIEKKKGHISRRAIIAGAVGLVAASSGLTWLAVSRTQNLVTQIKQTTHPFTYTPGITKNTDGTYTFPTPTNEASPLITYTGHQDYIWSVDWSPDGRNIVSGSKDGTAHVWNADNGKKLFSYRSRITPSQNDDWAYCVRWARDSRRFAVGFFDGTTQIVDINSVREVSRISTAKSHGDAIGWSPDGRFIAIGDFDGAVWVYDVASGNTITTCTGHTDGVSCVAWSPDGKRIVSGSSDTTVRIWNAANGQELLTYKHHTADLKTLSWSHDGTRIASAGWDGQILIWDATTGYTQITYTKHIGNGQINAVAWSHNDNYIASGGGDVHTYIWDVKDTNTIAAFYTFPIFGLSWAPDDKRLATAGYNKTVTVWQVP